MIRLFSTNCPKCKVIGLKLNQKKIEFEIITDTETVVNVGKEHGILSAPILQVDDRYMDFTQALKYINERN